MIFEYCFSNHIITSYISQWYINAFNELKICQLKMF